jgi:predicted GNAT family acetyltransferase
MDHRSATVHRSAAENGGKRIMDFKSDNNKTWLENEEGKVVALLEYPEVRPGVVNLVHTEVDPSMNGQGIAGRLTEFVAKKLRDEGIKAELSCSYSIRWFSKHPEYADILADPEAEARNAEALGGPACGIRR